MKVSIITATYNSEQTLADTIKSVSSQDYKNIELIIVDGDSKDETLDIVKNNPHVSKWVSEPDKGIYDALNKGISMATGDIIGFAHSDDIFESNSVVSKVIETIKNAQVDGVYGDLHYVDKKQANKIIRKWKSCDFTPSLLKKGWMPPHPTLFLKKEVYDTYGLFDLQYRIAADFDFIVRIFKDEKLKFSYIPEVLVKMRIGGESNKSLSRIIQKSKEDLKVIRKYQIGGVTTLLIKNLSKLNQFF